jgi:hypothetical protein
VSSIPQDEHRLDMRRVLSKSEVGGAEVWELAMGLLISNEILRTMTESSHRIKYPLVMISGLSKPLLSRLTKPIDIRIQLLSYKKS